MRCRNRHFSELSCLSSPAFLDTTHLPSLCSVYNLLSIYYGSSPLGVQKHERQTKEYFFTTAYIRRTYSYPRSAYCLSRRYRLDKYIIHLSTCYIVITVILQLALVLLFFIFFFLLLLVPARQLSYQPRSDEQLCAQLPILSERQNLDLKFSTPT